MAVKRLRQKIEDDPSQPVVIQTVRGIGYRLEK
jgi:DNA-binding response OmpR family regulator